MIEKKVPIVAIDGLSGSGKSAAARRLASRLGIPYVDTGAMYRALSVAALNRGVAFREGEALRHFLDGLSFRYGEDSILVQVDGVNLTDKIRDQKASEAASVFSALPSVRDYLTDFQRRYPRGRPCVMEGRDIGTVVFPNALCKFFITASDSVRACRRLAQLNEQGLPESSLEEVMDNQRKRDERDSRREQAPLKKAQDGSVD